MNRRSMFGWLAGLPFLGFLGKAQANSAKVVHDVCPFHPKETQPVIKMGRTVPKSTSLAYREWVASVPGRIGFADPTQPQEYYCRHCLAELARSSNIPRLAHEGYKLEG